NKTKKAPFLDAFLRLLLIFFVSNRCLFCVSLNERCLSSFDDQKYRYLLWPFAAFQPFLLTEQGNSGMVYFFLIFFAISAELFFEYSSGDVYPRLHRSFRNLQLFGNFVVFETVEEHGECSVVIFRELAYGGLNIMKYKF